MVIATAERDGEVYELLLDDPEGWLEERHALESAASWSFVVRRAVELPEGFPRQWDLRAVGVQPFA